MKFFGLTLAILFVSGLVFAAEARSVEKRNVFNDFLSKAKEALNDAKSSVTKFFNGALSEQIKKARESFVSGLEQLQEKADDLIEDGVDALHKYLPGLQGIVSDRVDKVSAALDKYVSEHTGKLDEVRQLLLENAQKALTLLKERLHAAQSTEAVNQVVSSVDNIENQVVSEVSAAKSRSMFGINWSGLKQTVSERFDHLKNKLDDMMESFAGQGPKIQQQKDKATGAMEKIHGADKLPAPQKIEAVKEATAELDSVAEAAASVEAEESTEATL